MDRYVILLHGLIRTKYSLLHLSPILRRAGLSPLAFGYRSRRYPIRELADQLQTFISDNIPPNSSLSFVTHSLGSIVLRQFSLLYSDRHTLHRAVMLGPPNQGSETARMVARIPGMNSVLGPAFRELQDLRLAPASDRLEIGVIAGGREKSSGYVPFVSGDNDGIVRVSETELDGVRGRIIVPALHSVMMYSPRVIRETVHFLNNGRFNGN